MRILKILIAITCISWPILSSADRTPHFEFAGTVDRIDLNNNVIVIGDILFQLSPDTTVTNRRKHHVEHNKLRTGMKVGIKTHTRNREAGATRYLYEIQILPQSTNLEEVMDDH